MFGSDPAQATVVAHESESPFRGWFRFRKLPEQARSPVERFTGGRGRPRFRDQNLNWRSRPVSRHGEPLVLRMLGPPEPLRQESQADRGDLFGLFFHDSLRDTRHLYVRDSLRLKM